MERYNAAAHTPRPYPYIQLSCKLELQLTATFATVQRYIASRRGEAARLPYFYTLFSLTTSFFCVFGQLRILEPRKNLLSRNRCPVGWLRARRHRNRSRSRSGWIHPIAHGNQRYRFPVRRILVREFGRSKCFKAVNGIRQWQKLDERNMHLPRWIRRGINLFCHELGFWVVGTNWMTVCSTGMKIRN